MDAYVYRADLYCTNCARMIKDGLKWRLEEVAETEYDSDEYPKGPYPDGGGESDTPQHCGGCNLFLENPLTGDGEEYVMEALADGDGDPDVFGEWSDYYHWLVFNKPEREMQ